MLSLILAAALQAALLQSGAPAASTPHDAARPPASAPTTVAPVTSEASLTYGIVEGKGQAKGKKVCFNDPMLGSKIPTKRCMDRDEFERQQRETRDYTRKIQDDARAPIFK
jgi:hypothetical protein